MIMNKNILIMAIIAILFCACVHTGAMERRGVVFEDILLLKPRIQSPFETLLPAESEPFIKSPRYKAIHRLSRTSSLSSLDRPDQKVAVFIENLDTVPLQISISKKGASEYILEKALGGVHGESPLPYRIGVVLPVEDLKIYAMQQHKRLNFGSVLISAAMIKCASLLLINRSNVCLLNNNNGLIKECSVSELQAVTGDDWLSAYVDYLPSKKIYENPGSPSLVAVYSLHK